MVMHNVCFDKELSFDATYTGTGDNLCSVVVGHAIASHAIPWDPTSFPLRETSFSGTRSPKRRNRSFSYLDSRCWIHIPHTIAVSKSKRQGCIILMGSHSISIGGTPRTRFPNAGATHLNKIPALWGPRPGNGN